MSQILEREGGFLKYWKRGMFFYEKGGKVKMVTIPIKYKKEEGKFENTEKKNQDCKILRRRGKGLNILG